MKGKLKWNEIVFMGAFKGEVAAVKKLVKSVFLAVLGTDSALVGNHEILLLIQGPTQVFSWIPATRVPFIASNQQVFFPLPSPIHEETGRTALE